MPIGLRAVGALGRLVIYGAGSTLGGMIAATQFVAAPVVGVTIGTAGIVKFVVADVVVSTVLNPVKRINEIGQGAGFVFNVLTGKGFRIPGNLIRTASQIVRDEARAQMAQTMLDAGYQLDNIQLLLDQLVEIGNNMIPAVANHVNHAADQIIRNQSIGFMVITFLVVASYFLHRRFSASCVSNDTLANMLGEMQSRIDLGFSGLPSDQSIASGLGTQLAANSTKVVLAFTATQLLALGLGGVLLGLGATFYLNKLALDKAKFAPLVDLTQVKPGLIRTNFK